MEAEDTDTTKSDIVPIHHGKTRKNFPEFKEEFLACAKKKKFHDAKGWNRTWACTQETTPIHRSHSN